MPKRKTTLAVIKAKKRKKRRKQEKKKWWEDKAKEMGVSVIQARATLFKECAKFDYHYASEQLRQTTNYVDYSFPFWG